jgi:nucleotide-binding universal stress UspA family protein
MERAMQKLLVQRALKKILVPLDGSAFAEHAVETARALADRDGASIDLVLVHQPVVPASRLGGAPSRDPRMDDERRLGEEQYIERINIGERSRSALDVRAVMRDGDVADEIVAQAREGGADLIAMTTHGRGGVGRMWLGSVADRVIRSSPVPVLLVRPVAPTAGGAVPLRRVLIATAGSDADDRLLDAAVALAGHDGVMYTLAHVLLPSPMIAAVDPAVGPPPNEMAGVPARVGPEQDHAAQHYLEWMAEPLRTEGAVVHANVVRAGSVPLAVLDMAQEVQADLIAVGTAARSPAARLFLGSTADKVVRSAGCSVLVCPPVERGQDEREERTRVP